MSEKEKIEITEESKFLRKRKFGTIDKNQPVRLWLFVLGLNLIAFLGFLYIKFKGISLYSFTGGG